PPAAVCHLTPEEIAELLERIARWDADAWFRDREAYRSAYGESRLPFLPPTCPQSIVLQATEERRSRMSWLFGSQEPDKQAANTIEEFDAHARAVRGLLGRRVAQARGIVLAGPRALLQHTEVVHGWLRSAQHNFRFVAKRRDSKTLNDMEVEALDGVFAFLSE